jgi:uncharacterized protein YkwD
MECTRGFRRAFWLFAAAMLMGCSMITGSIPAVMDAVANINPVVFVEPSNTPFLPGSYTDTPLPTVPPTDVPSPTPTLKAMPTDTVLPTITQTPIPLPSVTPTSRQYVQPTVKPVWKAESYPTAIPKIKHNDAPVATATEEMIAILPSPTLAQTPTETTAPSATPSGDQGTQMPAATLAGSETAAPAYSATPYPTQTTAPVSTNTPVPNSTDPFPNCTYYLNADFENQIYARIIQARAEAGLWDLAWYAPLANGAQYHSIDMGCNRYFAHTGGVYENILAGYNTVEEAWNWWWNSKPHHDNILGQYYYKVGVGYASVPGSPYRYYWTIQFSR